MTQPRAAQNDSSAIIISWSERRGSTAGPHARATAGAAGLRAGRAACAGRFFEAERAFTRPARAR
jgi:hypothetical protein